MKFRKKTYNIIIYMFTVLILLSSIYIVFGNKIEAKILNSYRPKVNRLVINDNKEKPDTASYDWSAVSNTNLSDVVKARLNDSQDVVAIMTQPAAKVAVTVVNGVSNDDLSLSAGTVRQDQKIGEDNYVLAAHHVPKSDWSLFSGIYYFSEIGQKVYITDMEKVYEYEITDIKFVDSTAVEITEKDNYKSDKYNIVPGQPMFTAISCDATGKDKRIIEFGTLTNTYEFNKDKLPKEAIDGFERAANFDWKR